MSAEHTNAGGEAGCRTPAQTRWYLGRRPMDSLHFIVGLVAAFCLVITVLTPDRAFLVPATVFLLLFILIVSPWWRPIRGSAAVTKEGLLIEMRGRTDFFRWEEIERFHLDMRPVKSLFGEVLDYAYGVTILGTDGRRIAVPPCRPAGREIKDAIISNVHERLKGMAEREFFAPDRKALWFGPVSVSPAGVGCGGRFLAWNEIKALSIRPMAFGEGLKFRASRGRWRDALTCDVRDIPNLPVLLDMIAMTYLGEELIPLLSNQD